MNDWFRKYTQGSVFETEIHKYRNYFMNAFEKRIGCFDPLCDIAKVNLGSGSKYCQQTTIKKQNIFFNTAVLSKTYFHVRLWNDYDDFCGML